MDAVNINTQQDIFNNYFARLKKNIPLDNMFFIFGAGIVLTVSFMAIFAPFITSYDPNNLTAQILSSPSAEHILGTDALGRDVFSRLLYGGRVSLWVGFVSVGIAITIGIILGLLSGFLGGIIDELIMRLVDIMLCFPSFFLILSVVAFLEPSLNNIMIVIGFTSWMGITRLVRAETLSLKERDFIAAARIAGSSNKKIMFKHILPNALAPVLVSATLGIAGAILLESAFSFLGFGAQHPDASWGNMLLEGKETMEVAWWLWLFPGVSILITALGYNLLGEGLRDILDPRLKNNR